MIVFLYAIRVIRNAKSSPFITALVVEDIYKGQHIFQRDIALDGVGRCEDIATVFACLKQSGFRTLNILYPAVWQVLLGGKPRPFGEDPNPA